MTSELANNEYSGSSSVDANSPFLITNLLNSDKNLDQGKLLLSHDSSLAANLSLCGNVTVGRLFSFDIGDSIKNYGKEVNFRSLELNCIFETVQEITKVSNIMWTKALLRYNEKTLDNIPTLVILEQNRIRSSDYCPICRKHGDIEYITFIFFRLQDCNETETKIIELEIIDQDYTRINSCNFSYLTIEWKEELEYMEAISFIRIPTSYIQKRFISADLKVGNASCSTCFSYKTIQISCDPSMDIGICFLIANNIFLSTDIYFRDSLRVKRRFYLQTEKSETDILVQISGLTTEEGWLACFLSNGYQILIWNYLNGVAFHCIDLTDHYFSEYNQIYLDNSGVIAKFKNNCVEIKFLPSLCGLCIVPYFREDSMNDGTACLIIDLESYFSQLLCSFSVLYTLKIYNEVIVSKYDYLLDPGMEFLDRIKIGQGSIANVQLNTDYHNLTIFPQGFILYKYKESLSNISSFLNPIASYYLEFLATTDYSKRSPFWTMIFNIKWLHWNIYDDSLMNIIVYRCLLSIRNEAKKKKVLDHCEWNLKSIENALKLYKMAPLIINYEKKLLSKIYIKSDLYDSIKILIKLLDLHLGNEGILTKKENVLYNNSKWAKIIILPKTNDIEYNFEACTEDIIFINILCLQFSILIQFSTKEWGNEHLLVNKKSQRYEIKKICFKDFDIGKSCKHNHINIFYNLLITYSNKNIQQFYLIRSQKEQILDYKDCLHNYSYKLEKSKRFKTLSDSICILSSSVNLRHIMESMITLQHLTAATELCKLNEIDLASLLMTQVEVSIRNEELDTLASSLTNIPLDLHVRAMNRIADYLEDNSEICLSLEFKISCSRICLRFCLDKIKIVSSNSAWLQSKDIFQVLSKLSRLSGIFRRYVMLNNEKLPNYKNNTAIKEKSSISTFIEKHRNICNLLILGHFPTLCSLYLNEYPQGKVNMLMKKVFSEVYNIISSQQSHALFLAIHIVRNLGINISQFIKAIALYTLRRDLRKRLINHLYHKHVLCIEEYHWFQFLVELETAYPNSCYSVEVNRVWTNTFNLSYLNSKMPSFGNIDYYLNNSSELRGDSPLSDTPNLLNFKFQSNYTENCTEIYNNEVNNINSPFVSSPIYPIGGIYGIENSSSMKSSFCEERPNLTLTYDDTMKISTDKYNKDSTIISSVPEVSGYINQDYFISQFSTEIIKKWELLSCFDIEDFNQLHLTSKESSFRLSKITDKNMITNVIEGHMNIPEQEGANSVRLSSGEIIVLNYSVCKKCSSIFEEDFEPENSLSLAESKAEKITLPEQNRSSDFTSKQGGRLWLKLTRQRNEMANYDYSGYMSISLNFVKQWSIDTCCRVVLEKSYSQLYTLWQHILEGNKGPFKHSEALTYSIIYLILFKHEISQEQSNELLECESSCHYFILTTEKIYTSVFAYLISHHDWRGMWHSISVLKKSLDIINTIFGNQSKANILDKIIQEIKRYYPVMTCFLSEVFFDSCFAINSVDLEYILYKTTDYLKDEIFVTEKNVTLNLNEKYILNHFILSKKISDKYEYDWVNLSIKKFKSLPYLLSKELFRKYVSTLWIPFKNGQLTKLLEYLYQIDSDNQLNDYKMIIYEFLGLEKLPLLSLYKSSILLLKSTDDKITNQHLVNLINCNNQLLIPLNTLVEYLLDNYSPIDSSDLLNCKPVTILQVLGLIFIAPFSNISELTKLPESDNWFISFSSLENFLKQYFPRLLLALQNNEARNFEFQINIFNLLKMEVYDQDNNSEYITEREDGIVRFGDIPNISNNTFPFVKQILNYLANISQDHFNNIENMYISHSNEFQYSQKLFDSILRHVGTFSKKETLVGLPLMHYIATGRPFMALHLLSIRYKLAYREVRKPESILYIPILSTEDKIELYSAVYKLALRNFTRDPIVCACITFISLLNFPTELLCTDVQAARCIYSHLIHVNNNKSGSDQHLPSIYEYKSNIEVDENNYSIILKIWNLFIQFGPHKTSETFKNLSNSSLLLPLKKNLYRDHSSSHSNALFTALKMLEEAAWADGDIQYSTGNSYDIGTETSENDILPHIPIWQLVAAFCRIHDLPRSLTLLHELASKGEWIPFFYECDIQKCPFETVKDIVIEYISAYPQLQRHLKIALNMQDNRTESKKEIKDINDLTNCNKNLLVELLMWSKMIELNKMDLSLSEKFLEWIFAKIQECIKWMNSNFILLIFPILLSNFSFLNNLKKDTFDSLIKLCINCYLFINICWHIFELQDEFITEKVCLLPAYPSNYFGSSTIEREVVEIVTSMQEIINTRTIKIDHLKIGKSHKETFTYFRKLQTSRIANQFLNKPICETILERYNDFFYNFETGFGSDQTTIFLWELISRYNQYQMLYRLSKWFYGKNSFICILFRIFKSMNQNNMAECVNLLQYFCKAINQTTFKGENNVHYTPSIDFILLYFEHHLNSFIPKLSIVNHNILWNSIYNIYTTMPTGRNSIDLSKYLHRRNIVELATIFRNNECINKYLEQWISMAPIDIANYMYELGEYQLLIKYCELTILRSNVNTHSDMLLILEKSFLNDLVSDFLEFSHSELFNTSSIRLHYIRRVFWKQLKITFEVIYKISPLLAPYLYTKMGIFCWYIAERCERLLNLLDQSILLSISLHIFREASELYNGKSYEGSKLNSTGRVQQLIPLPLFFDEEYIQNCIYYANSKLLIVLMSSFNDSTKLEFYKKLLQTIKLSSGDIKDIHLEYSEEIFYLFEKCISKEIKAILFTPSGYFNFQSLVVASPFNIHIPNSLMANDYPVDAMHIVDSINKLVDYAFNLKICDELIFRFVPTSANKIAQAEKRLLEKVNCNILSVDTSANKVLAAPIPLSRNNQTWDIIVNIFVETKYILLAFKNIIASWLLRGNVYFSINSNENNTVKLETPFLWSDILKINTKYDKPECYPFDITFCSRIQSILNLFQFTHELSYNKAYTQPSLKIKSLIMDFVQNWGVSSDPYDFETIKCDINNANSQFIITLFYSPNFIIILEEILLLAIIRKARDTTDEPLQSLDFDSIIKSFKNIINDNPYFLTSDIDSMLTNCIIKACQLNSKSLIYILNNICILIYDTINIGQKLMGEYQNLKNKLDYMNCSYTYKLYIVISAYLCFTIGSNKKMRVSSCESGTSHKLLASNCIDQLIYIISNINESQIDTISLGNIILEFPEMNIFENISSNLISQIILDSLNINSITNLDLSCTNIISSRGLMLRVVGNLIESYNKKGLEGSLSNLALLHSVGCNDILVEYLVQDCLSKQWKYSTNFMYSDCGEYDILLACRILVHCCKILKLTNHQKMYQSVMNLSGIFLLQLHFIQFFKSSNNHKQKIDTNLHTEISNQLKCIISDKEITRLLSIQEKENLLKNQSNSKITLFNLSIENLFVTVLDEKICSSPYIVGIILSTYEMFYGPVVLSVWPRILFKQSIILGNFDFIKKYIGLYGYLDSDTISAIIEIYHNCRNKKDTFDGKKLDDILNSLSKSSAVEYMRNYYELVEMWNLRGNFCINKADDTITLNNWSRLIEFINNIPLKIYTCEQINPVKLSHISQMNKILINDQSLYDLR
ncbi:uncharacterized protein CMU_003710 [Cryptosporidium muris RN66]|uniref:Spatacsin C-terminal domain-containing protein n=1 Tax=Cryptosporidium muris (strain RN66) TaxID=441375 RepID=B6AJZ1_CRYMR|nr:uncharacterized protein CMU_003710 [Cryptosporidium muris RN66]EEA08532.1 hypothetical protein, conserved [Cryptosporidium muris RN66]|eukprot:XP_002142881.1 hypothetical protein [Cryptosporidium muris RN66]